MLATTREPVDDSNKIIVGNRSISVIAQNSALHEKYSVYQIMRAFYLENSDAFENGNIDKLLSGSSLILPDESLIAEVPRQKAVNFVYSVSKDNVTKSSSTSTASRTGISELETPAEIYSELNTPAASSQSSVNEEPVKATIVPFPESIQRNAKSWREIAKNFTSISRILNSHNKAMRLQNDDLISMSASLNDQAHNRFFNSERA